MSFILDKNDYDRAIVRENVVVFGYSVKHNAITFFDLTIMNEGKNWVSGFLFGETPDSYVAFVGTHASVLNDVLAPINEDTKAGNRHKIHRVVISSRYAAILVMEGAIQLSTLNKVSWDLKTANFGKIAENDALPDWDVLELADALKVGDDAFTLWIVPEYQMNARSVFTLDSNLEVV